MSVLSPIVRLIDLAVPPQLFENTRADGGSALFRTRVLLGFAALQAVLVLVMFVTRLSLEGARSPTLWVLLGAAVVLGALVPLTRVFGSARPIAWVLVGIALFIVPMRAIATGGISSTVAAWFCAIPVVGWLAMKPRAALALSILAPIEAFIVAFPEVFGFVIEPQETSPVVRYAVLAVLLVLIAILASFFELARRMQIRTLTRVLDELEAASRAKSEFLAAMSHELRTPLNGVMGMTQLLAQSSLDDEQRGWTRTLDSSAALLLTVIDDVLQFSKLEAGMLTLDPQPFRPESVLRDVASLLRPNAAAKGIALRLELDEAVPEGLLGDDVRLRQVVMNLVGNAIKFTEQGAVTVSARPLREGGLRVEVRDTGIGISPEAQGRIFERFSQADASTTRRFGGTGLGLAISRGLIDAMNGRIGVVSTLGEGSTFWFEVPLPDAEVEAEQDLSLGGDDVGTARILVVEDNPVNQLVVRSFLQRLGHEPDIVDSGEQALVRLEREGYDLVLMDCEMPGLDGYETTRLARERFGSELPILALTAHAFPEAIARCRESGMDDHLAKPVLMPALAAALQRHLSGERVKRTA